MTFDPLGPGTPAWTSADKAIDAYIRWLESGDQRSRRSYHNHRQRMLYHVARVDPTQVAQWATTFALAVENESGRRPHRPGPQRSRQ
jgi:hypothetical protein